VDDDAASDPAPERRASWVARVRGAWRDLPPFMAADQARLIVHLLRWVLLGSIVGVLSGVSSWGLLKGLDWATTTRLDNPWLLYLLPVAGLAVGAVYHHFGGRSIGGNNLLLDEIHTPMGWIPRRMSVLVYAATVTTQLFGGSAGREGTAVQMAGSLTDWFSRAVHLKPTDRRVLLIAALSGGFGAMFGVPLAGAVFGLEVQSVGRMHYEELVPALTASVVGDGIVRLLGGTHIVTPMLSPHVDAALVAKVALAGLIFGVVGIVFVDLTHAIRHTLGAAISWPPARPVLGGVLVIGLAVLVGRDYLGLSIPLAVGAINGQEMGFQVFALKLLFTAVTLGSGFHGGEVTPLFIIGATLGAALAHVLGVPVEVLAAVGYVAVFAGAANTPLTCTIMGVELFGAGMVVPVAVACVISYIFSSHRSIYDRQRIGDAKGLALRGGIIDEVRRRHQD
jgi:H+/Cl- antiporter ClcA